MAKMTDLLRYLNDNGVEYRVLEHPPAFSARDVAVATRVPPGELAKVVLVRIDDRFWMTVLRADQRVSENRLKRAFGAKHVRLAHEEDLGILFPDCQLGAMPPFGNLYGLPVLVDHALTRDEEIVFNACTHTKAVRMRFEDYRRLVHPVVAEIAESPSVLEDREH